MRHREAEVYNLLWWKFAEKFQKNNFTFLAEPTFQKLPKPAPNFVSSSVTFALEWQNLNFLRRCSADFYC